MDNLVKGVKIPETLDQLIAKKDFQTILAAAEDGKLVFSNITNLLSRIK